MGLLDKISGLTVEGPMPSPRHRKSDPRRGKGVFYRVGVGFGPDGFSWEIHQDRIHLRKTNKKRKQAPGGTSSFLPHGQIEVEFLTKRLKYSDTL